MSIKGIDTQIMINRLPDNVREASAIQKRPETIQDVLAQRELINDAQEQSRVAKTSETEMERIRSDVDEGGGAAYEGGEGGPGSDDEEYIEELDPDMIVPPGNHMIDIII